MPCCLYEAIDKYVTAGLYMHGMGCVTWAMCLIKLEVIANLSLRAQQHDDQKHNLVYHLSCTYLPSHTHTHTYTHTHTHHKHHKHTDTCTITQFTCPPHMHRLTHSTYPAMWEHHVKLQTSKCLIICNNVNSAYFPKHTCTLQ